MPNIPDITPEIDLDLDKVVNMLISSIALEEIGLSHIINAEAEKIQYVLGTLDTKHNLCSTSSLTAKELLMVNKSVDKTLRGVLKNQMLLQMKLEDAIELLDRIPRTTEHENCEPSNRRD